MESRSRSLRRWAARVAAAAAFAALLAAGATAVLDACSTRAEPLVAVPRQGEVIAPMRPHRPRAARPGRRPGIVWRRSRAVGHPTAGRLAAGVLLPAEGDRFFTWDPIRKRAPNRAGRRWATDRLVRTLLRVIAGYARAHPDAPRVGIGDLSRRRGGPFPAVPGFPGHASHQNGLDVDVYYPRRDGRERPPTHPGQIDRRLAQDLVDRFVAAGATRVFVGPNTGLAGPAGVVEVLPAHHDNHMHVRVAARPPLATFLLGRSYGGRPIRAFRLGNPQAGRTVLVVGSIHGDEPAGVAVARRLLRVGRATRADLWVVPSLNPDGLARGTRQNARGVDLNRNFPAEWRAGSERAARFHPGPRPLSERETRIGRALVLRARPDVTVWFHQPQALVRAWGPSVPAARRYARLSGLPFRAIRWPPGTAPNWQNRRFPGTSSFVVELPPGPLAPAAVRRHAAAILRLAR